MCTTKSWSQMPGDAIKRKRKKVRDEEPICCVLLGYYILAPYGSHRSDHQHSFRLGFPKSYNACISCFRTFLKTIGHRSRERYSLSLEYLLTKKLEGNLFTIATTNPWNPFWHYPHYNSHESQYSRIYEAIQISPPFVVKWGHSEEHRANWIRNLFNGWK